MIPTDPLDPERLRIFERQMDSSVTCCGEWHYETVRALIAAYRSRRLRGAQEDIRAFHEACDLAVRDRPTAPGADLLILRRNLVREEAKELVEALEMGGPPDLASMAHVAKEMADVIVVVLGTAVSFGIDLDPVWRAVQESNMAKRDPATGKVLKRPDGKVLKPEGWKPPNIEAIVSSQIQVP